MKTTEEIAVGFYIWMQENGYDHNIKKRVEGKFKEYHQSELLKLNKSDVISSVCEKCEHDKYKHSMSEMVDKIFKHHQQTDL